MHPDLLTIEALTPYIDASFSRSSGPGGQNVNKVNTRVTLLFDFRACEALTPTQKGRIASGLTSRMSSDGRLRIVSQKERTQLGNRLLAEERLLELLRETLRTRKIRRASRPSLASKKRRVADKRRRGEIKSGRRRPMMDD